MSPCNQPFIVESNWITQIHLAIVKDTSKRALLYLPERLVFSDEYRPATELGYAPFLALTSQTNSTTRPGINISAVGQCFLGDSKQ